MARAYYSTVFSQSPDDLWSAIRDWRRCGVMSMGGPNEALGQG
jgi:hypothetical protein